MLVHYVSLQELDPLSDPKFSVTSRHVKSSALVQQPGRESVYAKMLRRKCYSYSKIFIQ